MSQRQQDSGDRVRRATLMTVVASAEIKAPLVYPGLSDTRRLRHELQRGAIESGEGRRRASPLARGSELRCEVKEAPGSDRLSTNL